MKKCKKCDYEKNNEEYKICPICGEELEVVKGKKKYLIGLSAEAEHHIEIELTYEEAKLINTISEELGKDSPAYCGSFWINFD